MTVLMGLFFPSGTPYSSRPSWCIGGLEVRNEADARTDRAIRQLLERLRLARRSVAAINAVAQVVMDLE